LLHNRAFVGYIGSCNCDRTGAFRLSEKRRLLLDDVPQRHPKQQNSVDSKATCQLLELACIKQFRVHGKKKTKLLHVVIGKSSRPRILG
jgi:hypothetical protein